MKRTLFATFSALFLATAITPAALAVETITPNNLVNRAYNGAYAEQGIPGFQSLANAQRRGNISAEDLINRAIAEGRLTPDTLADQGYVNSVEYALQSLGQDNIGD